MNSHARPNKRDVTVNEDNNNGSTGNDGGGGIQADGSENH